MTWPPTCAEPHTADDAKPTTDIMMIFRTYGVKPKTVDTATLCGEIVVALNKAVDTNTSRII